VTGFADLLTAIDKVQTSIEVCVNYRTGIEEHTAGDDGKVELVPPRLACRIGSPFPFPNELTMSTVCATATRRECEPELEHPLPFKDLPPDVQERAIAKRQNDPEHSWPEWHDVEFLTETLVNDLEFEFGLTVATRFRLSNGKTTNDGYELYWGTYRTEVEFQHDALDLDKFLAHGVAGCGHYDADIAAIRDLMHTAEVIGAMFGVDIEWDCSLRDDDHRCTLADWNTSEEIKEEQQATIEPLAEEIRKRLKAVYRTACYRVYKIIEAEIDYHNSDECIRELLENDNDLFDDEGEAV